MMHKQSGEQDQHEDAPHTFQRLHAHVFDIQAIFLVEAVCVFDLASMAPFGVHRFGIGRGVNGYVCDQDQVVTRDRVVCYQYPQLLLRLQQADLEPAQFPIHDPNSAGVGEGHPKLERQRHRGGQVVQQFFFPVVQAVIVDFNPAIVAGSDDEFPVHQVHLAGDILVIQARIPDITQLGLRKQSPSYTDCAIDLSILDTADLSRTDLTLARTMRPRMTW